MTDEEQNVFDTINPEEFENKEEQQSSTFNVDELSNRPVGEKYQRADLNGQTVVIKNADILRPASNAKVSSSVSGKVNYVQPFFLVEYETENNDREYYSGVKIFQGDDGKFNGMPNIYVDGDTQATRLWKAVAEFKKIDPKELSMSGFLQFLKSKPKAVLESTEFKWDGKVTKKNMVKYFVA